MLHQPEKGRKESTVNSLNKKNIGKEMRMNIQIGDYEVDSLFVYLGLEFIILKKQTWEDMGKPQFVWYPI